jgi:hypothetical protein
MECDKSSLHLQTNESMPLLNGVGNMQGKMSREASSCSIQRRGKARILSFALNGRESRIPHFHLIMLCWKVKSFLKQPLAATKRPDHNIDRRNVYRRTKACRRRGLGLSRKLVQKRESLQLPKAPDREQCRRKRSQLQASMMSSALMRTCLK